MRDYTFLRLDISVRPVARVLERVPGVTVTEESDDEERLDEDDLFSSPAPEDGEPIPPSDTGRGGETPPPSDEEEEHAVETDETAESGGLTDRLPPVVREWGLLVAGVVLLGLGVISTVLWAVLRRRGGDESDPEEPAVDSFDEPVDEWRPKPDASEATATVTDAEADIEREADQTASVSTATETSQSTVLDEEPDAVRREPSETGPSVSASEPALADDAEDETPKRPPASETGAVDVAPLLGMGFLTVAAALVRWAQGESTDETTVR